MSYCSCSFNWRQRISPRITASATGMSGLSPRMMACTRRSNPSSSADWSGDLLLSGVPTGVSFEWLVGDGGVLGGSWGAAGMSGVSCVKPEHSQQLGDGHDVLIPDAGNPDDLDACVAGTQQLIGLSAADTPQHAHRSHTIDAHAERANSVRRPD